MRVDLHIHSTFSDGTETPLKIANTCKKLELDVYSITDHDTISGLAEKLESAKKLDLRILKGIEFSAYTAYQTHILGYNFDENEVKFSNELKNLKHYRNCRAEEMLIRLKKHYDIEINDNEIIRNADNGFGSMHVAKVLVKKGYAKNVNDAFSKYIGFGTKGFVGENRISPQDAIELIIRSGGVAVLAHPGMMKCDMTKRISFIKRMKDFGLKGIEAYHSSHTKIDENNFSELAKSLKLIITGGSDRHGDGRSEEIGEPKVYLEEEAIEVLQL